MRQRRSFGSSIWSAVNMKRGDVLTNEKRMQSAWLVAFAARIENKSGIYAYEQRSAQLPEPYAGLLRGNKKAWEFSKCNRLPTARRSVGGVVSTKQDATRRKRLEKLIAESAAGRRLR